MDVSRDTLKAVFGRDRVDDDINGIIDEIIKNPEQYRQKVLEYYENEIAENPEVCKRCGGVCCQRAPCHWSPKDIPDLSYKALKKLIKEKRYISIYSFPVFNEYKYFFIFSHTLSYFYRSFFAQFFV